MIDTKKLREAIEVYTVTPRITDFITLLDELDRVTAERDALKVDAERYRYLRANAADSHMWNDESIDAAIRASKGEK